MTSGSPAEGRFAFGVVLLGAGASSRMGRPKLLLPWAGTSVIGHLIGQWRALAAEQIAVVGAAADARLDAELNRLGFPARDRIRNSHPEQGMFSSILGAANWDGWHAGLAAWVIALGDQPHLRLATLHALLDFHRDHAEAVCQPAYGGRARHPVVLPRRAFAELRHSRAETLQGFLRHTSCPLATCPADDAGLGLDLDRPEDYEQAVRQFARPTQSRCREGG